MSGHSVGHLTVATVPAFAPSTVVAVDAVAVAILDARRADRDALAVLHRRDDVLEAGGGVGLNLREDAAHLRPEGVELRPAEPRRRARPGDGEEDAPSIAFRFRLELPKPRPARATTVEPRGRTVG